MLALHLLEAHYRGIEVLIQEAVHRLVVEFLDRALDIGLFVP